MDSFLNIACCKGPAGIGRDQSGEDFHGNGGFRPNSYGESSMKRFGRFASVLAALGLSKTFFGSFGMEEKQVWASVRRESSSLFGRKRMPFLTAWARRYVWRLVAGAVLGTWAAKAVVVNSFSDVGWPLWDGVVFAQETAAASGPVEQAPPPAEPPPPQTPGEQPPPSAETKPESSPSERILPPEALRLEEFTRAEIVDQLKLSSRQQAEIRRLVSEFRSKAEGADPDTQSQLARQYLSQVLSALTSDQRQAFEAGRPVPRLRFQFRFQRWEHVLEWLAEQAGLSLVLDAPPPGTFNYTDTREYTPTEAIDLVNSILLTKGYALIRRDQMLVLVSLRGGIPEGLVPWVTLEQAQRMGAYDLVTVSFSVGRRDASQVAEAIKPLVGPFGRVLPIPATRQVVVTDRAGLMATIDKVIQALPEPSPPRQEPPPREPERQELRIYPLGAVDPTAVMNVLRELFYGARIVHDPKLNQLNVVATPSQHNGIESVLKRLESPDAPERMPRLEVYAVPEGRDLNELANSLQLVAPQAKIRPDSETSRLIVWASPAEHSVIRASLEKLEEAPGALGTPQVETYRLSRSDARMLSYILEKLVPKAKVSYDYYGRNLVVYATPADQAVVRSLIEQIEPQAVTPGNVEVRVYTLRRINPSSLVKMLEEALPTAKFSADDALRRLTVVAPAAIQVEVERAIREADSAPEAEAEPKLRAYSMAQFAGDTTAFQTLVNSLQQLVPQAKITPDARRGQILVYATEEDHKRVVETLAQWAKEIQPIEGSLEVYVLSPEERARFLSLLSNLANELPGVRVLPEAAGGSVAVWARPHEHQIIREILSQLRQAEAEGGGRILRSYPLSVIELSAAQEAVKLLLPGVQVVPDPVGRRLLIWARQDEHLTITRTLEEIDRAAPQETQPRFETYPVRGVAAESLLLTLRQLVPGAQVTLDSSGRKIVAWGTPAEHVKIRAALAQLGQGTSPDEAPELVVYPLGGLASSQVLPLLQSLVPDAQLSVDAQANSLLAVAQKQDHETIRRVLDRLVEARRDLGGAELRYYPYRVPPSAGLLEIMGKLAPSAQITQDKENRRLIVVASPEDHAVIDQMLRDYQEKTAPASDRQLMIYQLSPLERKRLESLLPQLQSQLPDLQLLPETVPGEVAIWARPDEHRLLGEILAQLRRPTQLDRPYVLIVHPLRAAEPKSVGEMLQKLFPEAQVVLDARARRVMIWAPEAAEGQIRRVLQELDAGSPGQWQEQLRVYPVTKSDVQVALQLLRERVPEAQITADSKAGSLVVWATQADHEEISKLLDQMEKGVDEKLRPRVEVYPAGRFDLAALTTLLRSLVPEARLAVDPKTGGLAVLATPQDHELVRKTLEQLGREDLAGEPEARTYSLSGGGSVWGVIGILSTVFPMIRVTVGTQPNQILVWARPEEHELVAKVVAELQKEEPDELAPRLEVYALEGTNASEAGRILRQLAPEAVFTTGPDPQQLLVWARPRDHQKIRQALQQWLEAVRKPEVLPELAVYTLRYLSGYGAMQALRAVVPEAQFSLGAHDKQLVVLARPGQHERVAEALEKMDVPPPSQGELRVYTLEGMSATRAFYATRLLREAVPEATFALGADPTQLLVWGSPEVHEKVGGLVDTMFQRPPEEKAPRAEIYRLRHVTAASASQVLRVAVPDATLTPEPADPYKLTVWASPQEHELITQVLAQIDVAEAPEGNFVARTYTLEAVSPYYAVPFLTRMFPAAQVMYTTDPQQILVWAKAEEHAKIEEALAQLAPSDSDRPTVATYELRSLDSRTATNLIQSAVPGAKITTSPDGRKLLIYARQPDHTRIAELLRTADTTPAEGALRMEVYTLRGVGNAYTALLLLREAFPQARFSVGTNMQQLVVYASPAEHEQIAQAIERLAELTRNEQPEMVVYDVGTADASRLAGMLETAFPGTRFVPAGEPGKLIAWAPRTDHELIAQALEKLKAETWGPENRVLSVYPLRRADAQTLIQVLTPVVQGNAQFVVDTTRNSLVVWADRRYQEAIRRTVEDYLAAVATVDDLEPRVYRFRYADPSAAVTVVRALAPDAQISYDWANQALVVSATAEDHRTIELALSQLDRADVGGLRPVFRVYPLPGAEREQIFTNLRQLFRGDPSVQLAQDESSASLLVLAPEGKQEQIAQIIAEIELASRQGGGVTVRSYALGETDPQAALTLVRNLAQQRGFRADISLDTRSNALVVVAREEYHPQIAQALEQIRPPQRQLEILQLEELDPFSAQTAIRHLFVGEAFPPQVEVDYASQQLLVQATPEQHRKIRELLGKMGETRLAVVNALRGGTPRVIPFEGNALELLQEIERVWSRLRPNPLRVIVSESPSTAPSSSGGGSRTSPSGMSVSPPGNDSRPTRNSPESEPAFKPEKAPTEGGSAASTPSLPAQRLASDSKGGLAVLANFLANRVDAWVSGDSGFPNPSREAGTLAGQVATTSVSRWEVEVVPEVKDEGVPSPEEDSSTAEETTSERKAAGPEATQSPQGLGEAGAKEVSSAEETTVASAGQDRGEISPVYILVQDGSITVVSEDAEAASELESILRMLTARTGVSARSITVYELRHANASTVAELVEDFLRRSSWGFRRSLGGLVIIPDDRQNTLLVQGTRADRAVIEELLRVLDTPQVPQAIRANQPRIVPLRNMDASRAEEVVRSVFRVLFTPPPPRYTPWGTPRPSNPGILTPQLAVDQTTNSLIVSGPASVVDEIVEFVQRLDQTAAEDPSRQLMIIPLKKLNATQVERAVRDLVPRSYWRRY